MLRRYATVIACAAALALISCGIKGPLKLPPPKPAAASSVPPAPAAPAASPEAPLTSPPPSSTPSAPPPAESPTAPASSGAGKQ